MNTKTNLENIFSGIFALLLLIIGILNAILVHPVPGLIYLLLAALYLPQANKLLRSKLGFSIPIAVKIILGIFILMFTLGVSDLGDMIDHL